MQKRNQQWAAPYLRWAGSKRNQVPDLISYFPPDFRRYVEPFCGSAALFFAVRPADAILGDGNRAIIDLHRAVQKHPRRLIRLAAAFRRDPDTYYQIREQLQPNDRSVENAAKLLYLNRLCFNGVYRTNRRGKFNVPIGSKTGGFPTEKHIYRCSIALRSARLVADDFRETLEMCESGDFVYLDPPYLTHDRPAFGEYGYSRFENFDLAVLHLCLKQLSAKGVNFLLSYAATDEATDRFSNFHTRRLGTRRHVSGFAKHRKRVEELLVTNYDVSPNPICLDKR